MRELVQCSVIEWEGGENGRAEQQVKEEDVKWATICTTVQTRFSGVCDCKLSDPIERAKILRAKICDGSCKHLIPTFVFMACLRLARQLACELHPVRDSLFAVFMINVHRSCLLQLLIIDRVNINSNMKYALSRSINQACPT